jgi:hypothetical protein
MDDALTADLTGPDVMEVLVVPRTPAVPRRDARLLLAAASVVAFVAFAIGAHASGAGRDQDTSVRADRSPGIVANAVAIGPDPRPSAVPDVALTAPPDEASMHGASVVVTGRTASGVGEAWIGVRAGRIVLGSRSTELPAGGFSVDVPVYAPMAPATVSIEARAGGPDGPVLARSSAILAARFAVDLWSIRVDRSGDTCRAVADGVAPLAIATVNISVSDRGAPLGTGRIPIGEATDSAAGSALRLGRWSFEASWPASRGTGERDEAAGLRLDLAWADPVDGTSSELSIPVQPCAPDRDGPS